MDGPAGDMLSRKEVARLFDVSEDTIRRMVDEGEFPAPLTIYKQGQLWDWRSIAYYRLRVELGSRLVPRVAQTGKPTATEGQRVASD